MIRAQSVPSEIGAVTELNHHHITNLKGRAIIRGTAFSIVPHRSGMSVVSRQPLHSAKNPGPAPVTEDLTSRLKNAILPGDLMMRGTFKRGTMVDTFTILCMGNSHTAGFPDHDPLTGGDPTSSYQFWLNKALVKEWPETEFNVINKGVCGDTSRGITTRLFRELPTVASNLVILAGGTNDLGMAAEKAIIANLEAGYDACRRKKIPLIITTIPPISLHQYGPHVTALNDAIRAYSERHPDVSIADWHRVLQDNDGFLAEDYDAGDGVHLSRKGYERIGTLMAPIVGEIVSSAS